MYIKLKYLLASIMLLLSFSFLTAQCPTSLDNTLGNGALTLFFASGQTPNNLSSIDVDFPGLNDNYPVTLFVDRYQTLSNDFSGLDLTGDVTLNYSDGTTRVCAYDEGTFFNPLPVELADFVGTLNGINIDLQWKTLSEIENAGFELERSFDGAAFSVIGAVAGFGNSLEEQVYNFSDKGVKNNALGNTVYYRLVQIDYDGQKNHSSVLAIDLGFKFEKFEILKITGWDTTERIIQVYFYNPHDVRKVNFLIADIQGKIIERKSVYPQIGLNKFEVDLSNEPSPFYFLSLNNGKEIIGEKVVLGLNY